MSKPVATNKKAYRDFAFLETMECGIVLKGSEVKSIRAGDVNFKDSFARLEDAELYLYNLYIAPYAQASYLNPDSDRIRKLLLHKKEIKKLTGKLTQGQVTLVPSKIYFNKRGIVKVEVALATGKKQYDKREAIQKRDVDRQIARVIKQRQR